MSSFLLWIVCYWKFYWFMHLLYNFLIYRVSKQFVSKISKLKYIEYNRHFIYQEHQSNKKQGVKSTWLQIFNKFVSKSTSTINWKCPIQLALISELTVIYVSLLRIRWCFTDQRTVIELKRMIEIEWLSIIPHVLRLCWLLI